MTDIIKIYHKTKKKTLVVSSDADLTAWPDYSVEKGEHFSQFSQEEIEAMDKEYRKLRDDELARTDYMVLPDMNPTQAILDYRQALRDAPSHEGWPLKVPAIEKLP